MIWILRVCLYFMQNATLVTVFAQVWFYSCFYLADTLFCVSVCTQALWFRLPLLHHHLHRKLHHHRPRAIHRWETAGVCSVVIWPVGKCFSSTCCVGDTRHFINTRQHVSLVSNFYNLNLFFSSVFSPSLQMNLLPSHLWNRGERQSHSTSPPLRPVKASVWRRARLQFVQVSTSSLCSMKAASSRS